MTGQEPPGPDDAAASPAAERLPFRRRSFQAALGSKQATHGVYIEIVVLAVIIAVESKRSSDSHVALSVLGALLAVVLAEFYAYCLGSMIGTGRWPTGIEIRSMMLSTGGALVAAVPPILLLMLGVTGAFSLQTGFTTAKWAGVTVIGLYSLLAARSAGLSIRLSVVTALFFALIGLGLVLLKQYFH